MILDRCRRQHLKLKQMVILSPGRSSGYLDCRSAKYNIPMNQWRRDRGDMDDSPAFGTFIFLALTNLNTDHILLDHWSVGIGISVSVAADSSTFRCQSRRERELWRLIGCSVGLFPLALMDLNTDQTLLEHMVGQYWSLCVHRHQQSRLPQLGAKLLHP